MKVPNRVVSMIVLLALLSSLSFAEETFDANKFDYNNPDGYNALSVDEWKQLNQKLVPIDQISLIPPEVLDYSQIKDDEAKRQALTIEQIKVNLEKIDNLAEVNAENARQAISEEHSVSVVSFGKSAKIENGVLKSDDGDFVFSGKNGWEIEVDKETGRIKVLKPKEVSAESISQQDYFTLTEETSYTPADGSAIKVKQLSFKDGKSYVQAGEEATIGDYKIPATGNSVDIYFDATVKPEGNYVVITDNGLDIGTTKDGTVRVIPQPGNKLFGMVKRQYEKDADGKPIKDKFIWVPDDRDTLSITVSGGDNLEVISRAEEGKTTLIKHQNGDGKTSLENGRMEINFLAGELTVIPPKPFEGKAGPIDQRNSVAMELVSDGLADLFRTSSSNRYILLRNDKPFGGNSLGLEVSDFIEPNMMKTLMDMQMKYPKIDFSIGMATAESREVYLKKGYGNPTPPEYQEITANLAQTTDQWLSGKTGMNKYISQVYFGTQLNAGGTLLTMSIGERMMDSSTISSNPAIRTGTTPLGTLNHEFKHILKGYVISKEASSVHLEDSPEYLVEEQSVLKKFESGEITENELNSQIMKLGDKHFKETIKSRGIEREENKIAVSLADEVYIDSSKDFEMIVEEVTAVARRSQDKGKGVTNDENLKSLILESKDSPLRANYIYQMGANLDYWAEEKIDGAEELRKRYVNLIRGKTGFYPYAFRVYGENYEEIFPLYSESPISEAKKCLSCARSEYDLAMSTDPPDWLRKQAEDRYYQIMGGKDGAYCKEHGCEPCKTYKLTCNPM
jgi:hypothetical protein